MLLGATALRLLLSNSRYKHLIWLLPFSVFAFLMTFKFVIVGGCSTLSALFSVFLMFPVLVTVFAVIVTGSGEILIFSPTHLSFLLLLLIRKVYN